MCAWTGIPTSLATPIPLDTQLFFLDRWECEPSNDSTLYCRATDTGLDMRLAYRFRIYPTKAQRRRMEDTLEHCRLLYNGGLEQRRTAYQRQPVLLSKARQQADLPTLKTTYPEFTEVHQYRSSWTSEPTRKR